MCFLFNISWTTNHSQTIRPNMKPGHVVTFLAFLSTVSSLVGKLGQKNHNFLSCRSSSNPTDFDRPSTFLDEDFEDDIVSVTFVDEDEKDEGEFKPKGEGRKRWENLNPKIKQRLIERGQAKAIANKKKREPARDKKRRMYGITAPRLLFSSVFCCS